VSLILELCVEVESDIPFATREAEKMKAEVFRISPNLVLNVVTRKAANPFLKKITWDGGDTTVLNESPLSQGNQSLLITSQKVHDRNGGPIAGLAGPDLGWLSKPALEDQGCDSVHSVVHEWLHTIFQLTRIDPDRAGCYGFSKRGQVWVNALGQEFNQFVLSHLCSDGVTPKER